MVSPSDVSDPIDPRGGFHGSDEGVGRTTGRPRVSCFCQTESDGVEPSRISQSYELGKRFSVLTQSVNS